MPRVKTKVCSDETLGVFLLSCMKLAVASKKLVKEILHMKPCQKCFKSYEDEKIHTCGECDQDFCEDCITTQGNSLDDLKYVCVGCLEKNYDKGR